MTNLNARNIASNIGPGSDIGVRPSALQACVVHSVGAVHNAEPRQLDAVREVPVDRPLRKRTGDEVYDETLSSGEDTDPESDDTGEDTEPDTGDDTDSDQQ